MNKPTITIRFMLIPSPNTNKSIRSRLNRPPTDRTSRMNPHPSINTFNTKPMPTRQNNNLRINQKLLPANRTRGILNRLRNLTYLPSRLLSNNSISYKCYHFGFIHFDSLALATGTADYADLSRATVKNIFFVEMFLGAEDLNAEEEPVAWKE
ncbi:hypothetical protein N7490_011130 [Penicillium lividum]|nr:hypothetical protein N7490_011130 [Penicillium lividum]